MDVSGFRETLGGLHVEADKDIVFGNVGTRFAPGAAFLDIEHVDRNVLRSKIVQHTQILPPDFETLMWQPGDQIYADVFETVLPQRFDIPKHIRRSMQPAGV